MNAFRHSGKSRNPENKIMLVVLVLLASATSLTSAHAAELGRLFYTPQQRAQIDAGQTSPDNPESGARSYITVNGVIQKQGGKRTVWINGQQQPAETGNEKTPATVPVAVPGKSRPVQLKVGQRLLLNTPPPSKTEEDKAAPAKPATEEND